jgi:TolC family type I secretion outer membrane protein
MSEGLTESVRGCAASWRWSSKSGARRILCLAALTATLFAVVSAGQTAWAQTLKEALIKAYQTNPSLEAERARLRATDEGVAQALSNWRPTVSVSGDAGVTNSETTIKTTGRTTDSTLHPRGASLSVSQNVFRGGRTLAATSRAENQIKADRARLSSIEQTVLLETVTAYVNVVRDQAIVELNFNNERVLQRQLEATQDRFRVGEVTRTDVSQAESRLSRAQADRIRAEGNLIQSRAAFRTAIGELPKNLEAPDPIDISLTSEEEAVTRAREQSYTVLQAKYTEDVARDQIDEVFGEMLPSVSVTGELSRRDELSSTIEDQDSASITGRVSIPLYQSGGVASRVRAAKQTAGQRRNEYLTAVRDAVEGATQAWESLQTARAQIDAFAAEVRSADIALEGVKQEALVGSRTVLDVLDAEQELLDARVSLVTAQRDLVVATYSLRAVVGNLTAGKLGLEIELYDPTRHYEDTRGRWFGIGIEGEE